ncbi:MAG: helix-turn-helix transcriptional regulator [Deltaproteobacteria bacterium]|nr:helix-turn-helix transcriptional regulator [Deltaproteobacteria bacterium]
MRLWHVWSKVRDRLSAKKFGDLNFGKLIRSHRQSGDMTQSDLAKLLGSSKQYISQLEKGERLASVEQVKRLAEVFEMSPGIFVIQVLQG